MADDDVQRRGAGCCRGWWSALLSCPPKPINRDREATIGVWKLRYWREIERPIASARCDTIVESPFLFRFSGARNLKSTVLRRPMPDAIRLQAYPSLSKFHFLLSGWLRCLFQTSGHGFQSRGGPELTDREWVRSPLHLTNILSWSSPPFYF